MSIIKLRKELYLHKNPVKAKILSGFFKTGRGEYGENDKFLGVVVPIIRKIVRKYNNLDQREIDILIKSKFHEERLVALLILVEKFHEALEDERAQIFDYYLENTRYINNWDLVDLTAPHIVGSYLFNKEKKILHQLAKSKNLWKRRISIIATFYFIRNGDGDETLKISRILLHDKHDLIHKAVGWMIRELGKRVSLQKEEEFLDKHAKEMPRTMLRYAIERFPEKKRRKYLTPRIKISD